MEEVSEEERRTIKKMIMVVFGAYNEILITALRCAKS